MAYRTQLANFDFIFPTQSDAPAFGEGFIANEGRRILGALTLRPKGTFQINVPEGEGYRILKPTHPKVILKSSGIDPFPPSLEFQ